MDNMENERDEKKRSGLFLGIVGVATLIVAIIGASFAYFSIQAASAEGAVNLSAYQFSASLSFFQIYGPGENGIIPIDPDKVVTGSSGNLSNLNFALNERQKCTDDQGKNGADGYGVCALYKVILTRSGNTSSEETYAGKIVTNENTPKEGTERAFENLQYRPVEGVDDGEGGTAYTVGASNTAVALATTAGDEVSIGNISFAANETSKEVYFIIYLNEKKAENEETHEMEAVDQSYEMGATYKGQIVFTNNSGSSRLTGTFTVS